MFRHRFQDEESNLYIYENSYLINKILESIERLIKNIKTLYSNIKESFKKKNVTI